MRESKEEREIRMGEKVEEAEERMGMREMKRKSGGGE